MAEKNGSLTEQAVQKITDYILRQQLEAGSRIPTEAELCALTGASRNTVREAIRTLVARNVLEIRRGNGTFISEKYGVPNDPLGLTFVRDQKRVAQDLMQIRLLLEPPLAGIAAQNADAQDVAALEACCDAYDAAAAAGQAPTAQDVAFHRQLAACTKNVVMPNLIGIITETIRVFSEMETGLDTAATSRLHRQICAAIAARRPEEAAALMQEHVLSNRRKL